MEKKVQTLLRMSLSRFRSKEREPLGIDFTSTAKNTLRDLVMRPNPTLAEFPFLGIGENGLVEDVIVADRIEYSPGSHLKSAGGYQSSVDNAEHLQVWEIATSQKKLDNILLLGHSHPSGTTIMEGIRYSISPSDALLEPSIGHPDPLSNGDLAFYKAFFKLNPQLSIPFMAITAVTADGAKAKMYSIDDLLHLKRSKDLERLRNRVIRL